MENNLKNRYIYAVTRHLPFKMQADVSDELDSLISEMASTRGNNPQSPTEEDIKEVLAELGTAEELALKYSGNERNGLISGIYFLIYKRVLSIVLPVVAIVLAALTTLNFFIGDGSALVIIIGFVDISVITHVLQILTVTGGGVLQAFAIITVVFAFLDYKKVNINKGDFFDLPDLPDTKKTISPIEPIGWIVFSIVTTMLLLVYPHIVSVRTNDIWITIFNVEVLRGLWFPIITWTVLEIIAEIVKLVEGRYNFKVAGVTVVSCVLQMLCIIFIFGNNNIINHDFIYHVENFGVNIFNIGNHFANFITQPNRIIMGILIIVLVWEIIEVMIHTLLEKRS